MEMETFLVALVELWFTHIPHPVGGFVVMQTRIGQRGHLTCRLLDCMKLGIFLHLGMVQLRS